MIRLPWISRKEAAGLARVSGADLENDDRIRWQSARTKNGTVAPLPLTEAQAWREAHQQQGVVRLMRRARSL